MTPQNWTLSCAKASDWDIIKIENYIPPSQELCAAEVITEIDFMIELKEASKEFIASEALFYQMDQDIIQNNIYINNLEEQIRGLGRNINICRDILLAIRQSH